MSERRDHDLEGEREEDELLGDMSTEKATFKKRSGKESVMGVRTLGSRE